MRAAFFGTYNRRHTANRIAMTAVRATGWEVVEFHDALWERTRDKDASYFSPASLARLAIQWLGSASRLASAWRRSGGAPVAVVGFNGQLDVLLLRALAPRYGPRIVFAPLVSLTETLVEDRRVYAPDSAAARLLRALDRLTCLAADVVVVDTEAHRRYFAEVLGVDPSRLLVCHLGADPEVFLDPALPPRPVHPEGEPLEVLYFGQYLPLHGLAVICDAVGRLAMRDDVRGRLRFTFLGTGEGRLAAERNLRATRADVRFVDWVPYEDLAARIASADIVLGIFGASRKAKMVVPNKVYEAAAVGAAIVTADTPAIREVFEDGRELVLCEADGASLADAIARMADRELGATLRADLGASARKRMQEAFSAESLGRAWSVALRGPEALLPSSFEAKVGVVVLCFQDAVRTLTCLHSVAGDGWENLDVLVVDNGSVFSERSVLAEGIDAMLEAGPVARACKKLNVEALFLERNLGYAGANNLAMRTLFGRGCDAVLLLNSDAVLAPRSIDAMIRAMRAQHNSGPLGPRVSAGRPGGRPTSLGERYTAALLWAPRSLLRVRSRRQRPYPVSGVTGCALLVPRALFEGIGGFDESLFAYYEEVDLCLRAREAGFVPTIVPGAEVGHEGSRGFAAGMTPLSAWLKSRNLALVGRRRVRGAARVLFEAGQYLLLVASSVMYLLRGRRDVAFAMAAGLRAASSGSGGPPPEYLFAASGYAGSGRSTRATAKAAPNGDAGASA